MAELVQDLRHLAASPLVSRSPHRYDEPGVQLLDWLRGGWDPLRRVLVEVLQEDVPLRRSVYRLAGHLGEHRRLTQTSANRGARH
jgi:hypothetical protein